MWPDARRKIARHQAARSPHCEARAESGIEVRPEPKTRSGAHPRESSLICGRHINGRAGMLGDRADAIFAALEEISGFIKPEC
jgi:hypothetical protein